MTLIRPARDSDRDVLTEILRQAKGCFTPVDGASDTVEVTVREIHSHCTFVAEGADGVLGFYMLRRATDTGGELIRLLVGADHRGLGLGRELFRHMCWAAGDFGITSVEIVTSPSMESFYRKMGALRIGAKPPGRCSTSIQTWMFVSIAPPVWRRRRLSPGNPR